MTAIPRTRETRGAPEDARRARGQRAYLAGHAAEEQVAREYGRRGLHVEARRWRGKRGEIDLVLRAGETLVFVEVKSAASLSRAAESLSARQQARICGAAEEYLGQCAAGQLTEIRFDVALIDGAGAIEVIENAFGAGW